ncbi:atrial natriuretic peptide receptor 1-like isoform X1 [Centruroides sculpturatus]|uniref:atrial natriuretic peptide receptor 1-like isoform X1 n=3 Tax=Centruroides sculpturatus TaxID=218467 RepID=UPI000C6EAEDA|nr:atrial natriuretic peptide receptor 1-like isoform X1 [Centruroides sculpturatus]
MLRLVNISFLVLALMKSFSTEESEIIKFDRSSNDTVRVAVILPKSPSYLASIIRVTPAIRLAIDKVRNQQVLPGWKWDVHYLDSQCSSTYGPMHAVRAYIEDRIHLFLGPVCDYVTAPVGRLLKFWDVPLLTSGALARDYGLNKSHFDNEYYLLTRVGLSFNDAVSFLLEIFKQFTWRKLLLFYDSQARSEISSEDYCMLWTKAIISELRISENYVWQHYKLPSKLDERLATQILLNEVGTEFGVIVVCASPDVVRNIMLAADSIGMIDIGEYVFFSLELFSSRKEILRPWYRENESFEKNKRAEHAYKALFTLTSLNPTTKKFEDFTKSVKHVAKEEFGFDYKEEEVNKFVSGFYEAIILYSLSLNETLSEGYSITNGSIITQKMWNRTFQGITGPVSINENGDRNANYTLMNLNPHKRIYQAVAMYDGANKRYLEFNETKYYWPGKRKGPPYDTPICGFDRSKCLNRDVPQYAIVSVILLCVIVALCICSIFIYRHFKLEAEIASMTWRIKWEDLILISPTHAKHLGSKISLTRISMQSNCSSITMDAADMSKQLFARTGYFKGSIIAIKPILLSRIDITRPLLYELKYMKDLQHNHLVRFIGSCIDSPHCCLITEYCPKGSLQDILENNEIKLDWMFQCSLMHDIIKGMAYLHSSEIHSHGNLKSSNCVVDSRFVLKITDFGLHSLRTYDENENEDSYAHWRRKLWMAPELLRKSKPPPEGTQKGDVYSFAVVAHEIVMRQGPFYLGTVELSPKEIVENVKNKQKQPFRPYLGEYICEEGRKMIARCWSEDPFDRPDFQYLKSVIRKLNRENENGNILDNLLSRMEQYANNLEALVEERTADYLEEKRKAEDLLYQLLPKTVANQLILGEGVAAEAYDNVTIYFSDIVGFTALSAQSTPMQVVDFLNDLYTCFDSIIENYDVYKVETIGDAYMVVSGLPTKNGNKHVREIARMSLALLNTVKTFPIKHIPEEKLKLRIGIHTGPCAAGIVGLKMPRYCLFGDTVNTASRMESTGLPLKIHVSSQTKEALDMFGCFNIELRGEVEMKGKGKLVTYWLLGEHFPVHYEEAERRNHGCFLTE